MQRQLRFSQRALFNLEKIADYIADTFGQKRADQFLAEMSLQFERIRDNPERYPIEYSRSRVTHRCVFQKRTILLFRFSSKEVHILAIRDARSNWKPK
jgi:plasmid stabilization system protein ParE